ncbi:MAG: DUF3488 domain-containing protein, partial [Planctomycetaceae bacterium]
LMLWTMAVGNVLLRASEYELLDSSAGPGSHPSGPALRDLVALREGRRATTIDRHGLCQDTAGSWIGRRFVWSVAWTAALGLTVGVLVFLLIPRFWIGTGNPFLNTALGASRAVAGYSTNVRLGQAGTLLEDSATVFRLRLVSEATGEETPLEGFVRSLGFEEPYFRGGVLDDYRNGDWTSSTARTEIDRDYFEPLRPSVNQQGNIRQDYVVEESDGPVIFALHPVSLGQVKSPRGEVLRNLLTGALSADSTKGLPQQYSLWTLKDRRRPVFPELKSRGNRGRMLKQYLQVPPELSRLKGMAAKLAEGLGSDGKTRSGQLAAKTVELLRDSGEYTYNLRIQRTDADLDPVEDFLSNTRDGYCVYFASALALLLRSNEIPARMIVGYKGAELNSTTGYYEVQRRHAHAWVEAWYDDSWHTLDAVPAERDEEMRLFRSKRGFWGNARDSLSSLWSNYFVTMSIERQQSSFYDPLTSAWTQFREMATSLIDTLRDFGSVDPDAGTNSRRIGWWILAGLVAAGLLVRAVWRGGRAEWLGESGERRGLPGMFGRLIDRWFGRADPARLVVAFYEQFTRLLSERGLVRQPQQTQREFARVVATTLDGRLLAPGLARFPEEVTELFYRVRFGDGALSPDDLVSVERRLDEFAQSLRQLT